MNYKDFYQNLIKENIQPISIDRLQEMLNKIIDVLSNNKFKNEYKIMYVKRSGGARVNHTKKIVEIPEWVYQKSNNKNKSDLLVKYWLAHEGAHIYQFLNDGIGGEKNNFRTYEHLAMNVINLHKFELIDILPKEAFDKILTENVTKISLKETTINNSSRNDINFVKYIDLLFDYVKNFLKLKNTYTIYIVDINEIPTTTAYFNRNDKTIKVAIKNRALPDILRSIAHEIVHAKQDENGVLTNKSGITGSKHENQANTLAGIILRNFSQKFKEIYNL